MTPPIAPVPPAADDPGAGRIYVAVVLVEILAIVGLWALGHHFSR